MEVIDVSVDLEVIVVPIYLDDVVLAVDGSRNLEVVDSVPRGFKVVVVDFEVAATLAVVSADVVPGGLKAVVVS